MEPVRDLGRIELWQESLERSRARRAAGARASSEPSPGSVKRVSVKRGSVKRGERRVPQALTKSASPRRRRRVLAPSASPRRRLADRGRTGKRTHAGMLLLVAGGAVTAALLILLPGALAGREGGALAGGGGRTVLPAAKASLSWYGEPDGAGPRYRWIVPRTAGLTPGCRATTRPSHYVNPLAGAHVKPERIDQGVDYAGSGTLTAIGSAKITYVSTAGAGWPGSFIEYRLLDGAYAGCYVYYAEGVNPAAGLRVGQKVAAGQPIASIISGWATGIELGWGAGTGTLTYAAKTHQWDATSDENSKASPAGKSFSALIASLGGPPGKVEG